MKDGLVLHVNLSSQKYTINLFCCDGQNRTIQYCRNCDIFRNRLEIGTGGGAFLGPEGECAALFFSQFETF